MTWYKTGTVTVTASSTTVTGVGTKFVENLMVGDIFYGPDSRLYEITNIASNTALAVSPAYQGATAAGQAYSVIYTQTRNKQLADRAASLIGSYDTAKSLAEGSLQKSDNLAALTDKEAARGNLGLGSAATVDIVGTMGGGAIIERGSNVNGEYVRFADGTQVCWGEIALPAAGVGADNGASVPFASVFAYSPRVVYSPIRQVGSGSASSIGYAAMNGTYVNITASTFMLLSYHYRYAVDEPILFGFVATGRWK